MNLKFSQRRHFSPLVSVKLRGDSAGWRGAWHPSQIKMQCVELITRFIILVVVVVDVAPRHIKLYFTLAGDKNRI